MTYEVMAMFAVPFLSAVGAWMWSVEQRLHAHEIILAKLDQLITLLLEDIRGRSAS